MPEPLSTDLTDLLRRTANGDELAFRELYNQYQEKIYYLAWKLLGSEKETKDVLQEIFLKLWLHREKLAHVDHFNAYLNTLVRNHIYDRLRVKAIREIYLSDLEENESPADNTPAESLSLKQLETTLHEAVAALPTQQRKVFQLSRTEGLKHEEIAAQLQISKETVKKHMMEALKTIKARLAQHGISISLIVLARILF